MLIEVWTMLYIEFDKKVDVFPNQEMLVGLGSSFSTSHYSMDDVEDLLCINRSLFFPERVKLMTIHLRFERGWRDSQ